jgi:hypothetical protein
MEGKEIDADLTMLKGTDPEPDFGAMFANSVPMGPTEAAPNAGLQGPISEDYAQDAFIQNTSRQGSVDPGLDAFGGLEEDVNTVRSRNQSEGIKGIKALGGGLYQGALIALEQVGYAADLKTYTNIFAETADLSGNWWTNMFKDAQEAGREADMFKIYEDAPDQNSIASQIFKWTSLEGAISSSVGFGLSGLGSAKLVSLIGNTKKVGAMGKVLDSFLGEGVSRAIVGPLASSMTSNFLMGQMMAADTFKQSMDVLKFEGVIGEGPGKISMLEAQKIAAENANEVIGLNMALVATSYLKFGNIFKRTNKYNATIKNPAALHQLKELVIKGSPTAFTENVYQEMIQMEQIDDTTREAGIASEYSSDYWDRVSQLALSDRALHAGALGIAGGPIQFGIIQRPLMSKQLKEQKKAYAGQQASNEWQRGIVDKKVETFKRFKEASNRAMLAGDPEAVRLSEDMDIIEEIASHGKYGQLNAFKEDVQSIMNMTAEEKEANYPDFDDNYQETAKQIMSVIETAEVLQRQFGTRENADEIVYTGLIADRVLLDVKELSAKRDRTRLEGYAELGILFEASNLTLTPENIKDGKIKRDPNRFEGITERERLALKSLELKEDNLFTSLVAKVPKIKESEETGKKIEKRLELFNKLLDKYKLIITPEGAAKYKKQQDQAIADVEQTAKKEELEKQIQGEKKEADSFKNLEDIIKETPTEDQALSRQNNLENWKDTSLSPVNIIQGRTFSSIDKSGEIRQFTPHDLVRSVDGRYFRVKGQNYASAMKGRLNKSTAPVVYETDSNGKPLVKDLFELNDFSFLRPEVRQATSIKTDKRNKEVAFYYEDATSWGKYVAIDSVLKPNNVLFEEAKKDKAILGQAISVRNNEYVNNKAESLVPTEFASQYNFELANEILPEGETIDITIRKRKEGEDRYLDVYQGDQKIARLDRTSNLNYDAILAASDKGEVTGTIISKYTNKANFVKLIGPDGNFIRHDLREVLAKSKKDLPNGKLYLAQNPGDNKSYDLVPTLLSSDGEIIQANYLDVVYPGKTESTPVEIPWSKMPVGDSSFLILGKNGELIPMATASTKIKDLPSNRGKELYVDDVIEDIYGAMQELYSDIMNDESSFEEEAFKEFENNTQMTPSERVKGVKEKKKELISSKFEQQKDVFNAKVFTHFRQNFNKYVIQDKAGSVYVDALAPNSSGRLAKVLNTNYFNVGVGVDNNGKISPYIATKNPETDLERLNSAGTPRGDNFVYTYFSENPDNFKILIGEKQRRISLRDMEAANGDVTKAQDIMFNQGITTDVNPSQIMAGTGLTIQIDGADIASEGALKAASYKTKYIKQSEVFSESKENTDDVQDQLKQLVSLEEGDSMSFKDVALSEDIDEVIKIGKQAIRDASLMNSKKLIIEFEKYMNAPITEESSTAINEQAELLEKAGIKDEEQYLSKFGVFVNKVIDGIDSNEYKVVKKPKNLRANPEGDSFNTGQPVFNLIHGKGKITKKNSISYNFTTDNGERKVVYPHQTFLPQSDWVKMHNLEKQLERLEDDSPKHQVIKEQFLKLENKLKNPNKKPTPKNGEEIVELDDNDGDLVNTYKYFSAYMDVEGNKLNPDETLIASIYKAFKTSRGVEFVKGISKLQEQNEILASVEKSKKLSPEEVVAVNEVIKSSIMFTNSHIDALTAAKDKITSNKEASVVFGYAKELIDNLQTTERPVLDKVFYEAVVPGKGVKKQVLTLLGSEYTKRTYSEKGVLESEKVQALTAGQATIAISQTATLLRRLFELETEIKDLVSFKEPPTIPSKPKVPSAKTTTVVQQIDKDNIEKKQLEALNSIRKIDDNLYNANLTTITNEDGTISYNVIDGETQEELKTKINSKYQADLDALKTPQEDTDTEVTTTPKVLNNPLEVLGSTTTTTTTSMEGVLVDKGPLKGLTVPQELISVLEEEFIKDEDGISALIALAEAGMAEDLIEKGQELANLSTVKFKEGEEVGNENFEAEVARIETMIPQLNVEIIKDVARMKNRFGKTAIGAFDKGVIYLVNNAKKGTAYHEVFHAVSDLYLLPSLKKEIATEQGFEKWTLALEEKLADDFADYVNKKPIKTMFQKTVAFFKNLLGWKENTRSVGVTEKLFSQIEEGNFAKNPYLGSLNVSMLSGEGLNFDKFASRIISKDKVTLQKLIKKGNIKIVC